MRKLLITSIAMNALLLCGIIALIVSVSSIREGQPGQAGKDGKDVQGKDGSAGKDGTPGKDGQQGKDGKDGKAGEKGEKGAHAEKPKPSVGPAPAPVLKDNLEIFNRLKKSTFLKNMDVTGVYGDEKFDEGEINIATGPSNSKGLYYFTDGKKKAPRTKVQLVHEIITYEVLCDKPNPQIDETSSSAIFKIRADVANKILNTPLPLPANETLFILFGTPDDTNWTRSKITITKKTK